MKKDFTTMLLLLIYFYDNETETRTAKPYMGLALSKLVHRYILISRCVALCFAAHEP